MDKRKQLLKTEQSCLQCTAQGRLGDGLGFGQAQLAGDQAGEQGVAEGGEGLGLQLIGNDLFHQWINGGIEAIS